MSKRAKMSRNGPELKEKQIEKLENISCEMDCKKFKKRIESLEDFMKD